jgi:GNAT superfamily N-acetyltransferase
MRYMAVDARYRRRGVGTRILHALEHQARDWRAARITLHAREKAVAFYRRGGYRLLEPSHVLFGVIQHYRMEKSLSVLENGGDTRC